MTLLLLLSILSLHAQEAETDSPLSAAPRRWGQIDLSLTTGTSGIGFDVAVPLNDVLSLRGGYAIMPHVTHSMHFGVDVGDDPTKSQSKFERLAGLLDDMTGNKVDNVVEMLGKPTYWNWKLLVDVRPLRNKHWHMTAGIYFGNKQVAEAVNSINDMPSLMAVNIYNNMYEKAQRDEPFVRVNNTDIYMPSELAAKLTDYGRMSIHIGDYKHDVLYDEDVVATVPTIIGDDYYDPGDVIHKAGDVKYKKGDAYRLIPDEQSMVRAYAYANRWKPYVGFGYGGRLLKSDARWQVSVDAGAMFWGGTPQVVTHDGTDLVNDVENVRGRVGDYVNIIKIFKVFPVLNLRITRQL